MKGLICMYGLGHDPEETITFDDQEMTTLLELVETAFAQEMFDEGLENDARPTTAMVSLKSLELKLIRIRRGVNANTQGT